MKISDRAFNYDKYGQQYSGHRQTDPEIAKYIYSALGKAKTVINIGAGAGSYEPHDRYVIAVEPSATMRVQRLKNHRSPAVNAMAETLPFDDGSFDAATAFLTVHHWPDIAKGLKELRRVTRGQIIIMTYNKDALDVFWNTDYFPEVVDIERQRYPAMQWLCETLGGNCEIQDIPIPLNCIDGFQEAFYGRPEAFLSHHVRKAMSAWGFIPPSQQDVMISRFKNTLLSGEWDEKYGHLRNQPFFTGALRLVIAQP
jgi:ubiquinone/menaquinone biosynthesis C-methylase UbiE